MVGVPGLHVQGVQWRTWLSFCEADGCQPLPVTEAHLLAFVGWICEQREAGRRRIGASSIPQYIAAVRQRQVIGMGVQVPEYPLLPLMIRAYSRWEEAAHLLPEVRCGLSASQMCTIWEYAMQSTERKTVRDAAILMFAYCFNGLRESSVASMKFSDTEISDDSMTCRLSVLKGRSASRVSLVRFTAAGESLSSHGQPSPLDLKRRWINMRTDNPGLFAFAND